MLLPACQPGKSLESDSPSKSRAVRHRLSVNTPLFDAHSRAKVPEMFWSGGPHAGLQIELKKPRIGQLIWYGFCCAHERFL